MSDESLFREVDEEVRQEQFQKLWKQYGNVFIALCLLVVVGVAGFKGWQYWQVKQSQSAGDAFFKAVALAAGTDADKAEALQQFTSIDHTGFSQLARMREAALLAAQGKLVEAVSAYDAVAANASTSQPLRDLARIRAAYALVDSAKPDAIAARVKDFDTLDNPWRHMAREILLLSAWRAQDYAAADAQVKAIMADAETPQGVRQRALTFGDLLVPLVGK
ncbi:MAG: tetratricopeptide repeat protein [Alphaproteobacteria bacterium]|nr:tetratricopeptide repeat protein [Alphaproteobacteria bacterium]